MSDSASISSGIAERYATAVFEIVKEAGELPALEGNLDDLSAALAESADLRDLLVNPVYSRDAQGAAIKAVASKMGLMPAMTNVLGLMASKRRLFVVPQMVTRLREMIAVEKGEVTAEVTSAHALTDAQLADLKAKLQVGWAHLDWAIKKHLAGELTTDEASAAKLWHTDLQWEACDKALQLHGGAGYMNEYAIARLWRDARVTRIFGGTNEIMKTIIAKAVLAD